jgi:transforming growth factor-beta-induced protein
MSWRRYLMLAPVALFVAACSDVRLPTDAGSVESRSETRGNVRPAPTPAGNIVEVILAINAQTGEFSTAIQALTTAGLLEALSSPGPLTVFAPTDAAFARLGLNANNVGTLPVPFLTSLLTFHVAPGRLDAAAVVGSQQIRMLNGRDANVRIENGEVFLNNARIIDVDVNATNGVIHVLDAVLLRPASSPNFVDVLLDAFARFGEFSTLIAAVVAADLVGPLSSQGQGTVFAPTDAAFAALGLNAGNVGDIPREQLISILGFHIAEGRRDAAAVVGLDRLRMVNGDFTTIRVEGGEVFIQNARIISTDTPATNGIIHVVDAVLRP